MRSSLQMTSGLSFKSTLLALMVFASLVAFQLIPLADAKASVRQLEKKILDEILGHHYDSRIRPSGNNATKQNSADGACVVSVNIFVRSISRIDDVTMEYATQITFREEWNDDRLKFNNRSGIKFLTLTEPEKIWKPDLFFSNEKEGHFHTIIMPNVLLRIHPDGQVLYSIRISLVLFCPMHLKYFPLDMQTCRIQMASYGYTTEDLIFLWKKGNPVQITHPLNLPRFKLIKYQTNYCTSKTNTGEYSCILVDLIFKREFSYYLILIYVPCCMLVIVSWVSFWIDPNSTAARVLLGVTSLLTMSRQNSGINASLPPVSYTKAVDVWTGCCLTFVFGALIEFAVVNYVSRQDAHRKGRRSRAIGGGYISSSANRRFDRYNRKRLESGKDSGIESDDLEEMLGTRHVRSLGATRLSRTQHPNPLTSANSNLMAAHGPRAVPVETNSGSLLLTAHSVGVASNGTQLIARNSINTSSGTELNQRIPAGSSSLATNNNGNQATGSHSNTNAGNESNGNGNLENANDNDNSSSSYVNMTMSRNARNNNNNHHQYSNSKQHGSSSQVKHVRGGNFFINWLNRFPTRSKRIDVLSRIFFPLLFALFNVFYWVTYLLRDDLINS